MHLIDRFIPILYGLACCMGCTAAFQSCNHPKPVPPSDQVTVRSQDHMSTYVTISIAAPESPRVLKAIESGFGEITRLKTILSEWEDDSEISRVNAMAGKAGVPVAPELFEVIQMAQQVSTKSKGAFDITIASLRGLWDFGFLRPVIPEKSAVSERLHLVDYRLVTLDPNKNAVKLEKKGMRLGVGGIAKGYVVDCISRRLTKLGFPNHLVVAGGDLFAKGRKKSARWKVGIRSPSGPGLYGTLDVENEGVATSGDYERFFIKNGTKYHHLLDPKTGWPARGTRSATVIAPNAAFADAYATAVFVLGKSKGLAMAKREKGLEALVFEEDADEPVGTDKILKRVVTVR